MRKLSTVFLIAGAAVAVALAGCGGGGGGSSSPVTNPGQVIITGTVKDNQSTPHPVQGVLVKLNNTVVATNSQGQFSFTLPNPPAVQIAPTDAYFYVSTRTLDQSFYPQDFGVIYNTVIYPQNVSTDGSKIPIPANVYSTASGTVSLGIITVKYNDPSGPPGPPDL